MKDVKKPFQDGTESNLSITLDPAELLETTNTDTSPDYLDDDKEKRLEDEAVVDASGGELVASLDPAAGFGALNYQSGEWDGAGSGAGSAAGGISTGWLIGGGVLAVAAIAAASGGGSGGGKGGKGDDTPSDVSLSVTSPSITEGNSGSKVMTYTLTLSEPLAEAVSFNVQTEAASSSASAGDDYVPVATQVTFAPGQTSVTVNVTVLGDADFESNESIVLTVSGDLLTQPITGVGTITNDDVDPSTDVYTLTANSPSVTEGDAGTVLLTYTISLDRPASGNVVINYETLQTGTATPLDDYVEDAGAITFSNGQTTATLNVVVNGDELVEGNESVVVRFSGEKLTVPVTATGTIIENDIDPTAPTDVFELTVNDDLGNANIFNSSPDFTPGGDDFVNTLQDEDVLNGLGDNPTLNVTLGSVNDDAEALITPTLNGIAVVNVGVTGQTVEGLNFQDATGLRELNVTRITANNSEVTMQDLDATTTSLSVTNATREGELNFDYREDVLTALDDMLTLTLNSVRLSSLSVTEGGDSGEDQGHGFEVIDVVVNALSNIDSFYLSANEEEDRLSGADQTINLTADEDLEVNWLEADGAEFINLVANANVVIASDEDDLLDVGNDGISTMELQTLTLSGAGDVSIDGLDGDNSGATLTVAGGGLTGDLRLGVTEGADGDDSGNDAAFRNDIDLAVTSGSGNDEVAIYSGLAGTVDTGAGNDDVWVNGDLEGVSSINTGDGNDSVLIDDMDAAVNDSDEANNSGFDDVRAASIATGAGDDSVIVDELRNSQDWDNGDLTDSNNDDTYVTVAASISTDSGADSVVAEALHENALIDLGADDDHFVVENVVSGPVLEGDDRSLNGNGELREVDSSGAVDMLGAVVDLGSGNDVADFIQSDSSAGDTGATLLGADAELRGDEGSDVLNVVALDSITVAAMSVADDIGTPDVDEEDANAMITGIEVANLTIANQVDSDTANDVGTIAENDDNEGGGAINADILRFDSALNTLNLTSLEDVLLQDPQNEVYEAGTETEFNLFNLRESIAVNLFANEATGVSGAGELEDDEDIDVYLSVDMDNARAHDDTFMLDIDEGSGAFDLELDFYATSTDLVGDASSGTDDDDMMVEHVTLNLNDSNGHYLTLNGFGDALHTDAIVEGSRSVATSLTVNGSTAGTSLVVDDVTADDIRILGGADVTLLVSGANNYSIETEGGDDLIVMVADTVRADNGVDDAADADAVDETDEADTIDAGDGLDRLVVSADNNLGSTNAVLNGNTDDDVFEGLRSIEELEVTSDNPFGPDAGGANNIVIDEAAQEVTNLQSILFTGGEDQQTDITIGENFENALLLDASDKQAAMDLTIESQDSDADVDLVDLDVRLATQMGAALLFENTGEVAASVSVTATVSDSLGDSTVVQNGDGNADAGELDLQVDAGEIDSLVLLDNTSNDDGQDDDNDTVTVNLDDDWSGSTLSVDASAIADDDADSTTGGLVFDGSAESDAVLNVVGTANDDVIDGGIEDDSLAGGAGDDVLSGLAGADVLSGGAGNDLLFGGAGADELLAGDGDDRLAGGTQADSLTGGAGADIFDFASASDSNGNDTDVITDFSSGEDAIEIDLVGTAAADVFNLGSFGQVSTVGEGDNQLQGSGGAPVIGDAFYAASDNQLVVDADGDGDITAPNDYVINSENAVAAEDLNVVVNAGDGADLIRGGRGADSLRAGDGDDIFVLLGEITADDRDDYQAAGAGVIPVEIADLLDYNELITVRSATEINPGDEVFGGNDNDTLHLFGTFDMSLIDIDEDDDTVSEIETIVVHSNMTISTDQLAELAANGGRLVFDGDSTHRITVVNSTGTAVADAVAALQNSGVGIQVTNPGANTGFEVGGNALSLNDFYSQLATFVVDTAANLVNYPAGDYDVQVLDPASIAQLDAIDVLTTGLIDYSAGVVDNIANVDEDADSIFNDLGVDVTVTGIATILQLSDTDDLWGDVDYDALSIVDSVVNLDEASDSIYEHTGVDVTLIDPATIAQLESLDLLWGDIDYSPAGVRDTIANLSADSAFDNPAINAIVTDASTIAELIGIDALWGDVDYSPAGIVDTVANLDEAADSIYENSGVDVALLDTASIADLLAIDALWGEIDAGGAGVADTFANLTGLAALPYQDGAVDALVTDAVSIDNLLTLDGVWGDITAVSVVDSVTNLLAGGADAFENPLADLEILDAATIAELTELDGDWGAMSFDAVTDTVANLVADEGLSDYADESVDIVALLANSDNGSTLNDLNVGDIIDVDGITDTQGVQDLVDGLLGSVVDLLGGVLSGVFFDAGELSWDNGGVENTILLDGVTSIAQVAGQDAFMITGIA